MGEHDRPILPFRVEGICPEPVEDELFAMLLDEGVSPALASKLVVDVIRTGTGTRPT